MLLLFGWIAVPVIGFGFFGHALDDTQNNIICDIDFTQQDMDTRTALNAQSRTTGKEADGSVVSVPHEESGRIVNLQYFLISAPWLRRAWKLVLKPPTCMLPDCLDRVGRIDNAALYETETTESSAQQQQQSTGASSSSSTTTTPKLRPGLQHEHDYYLVGNNAWLLLSQKFGITHTCPAVVRFHTTGDESKLAVDPYSSNLGSNQQLLRPGTVLVPLPGSGRFPYERSSLDMEDTTNDDDNNNNAAAPPAGYQALETTNTRQPVSDDESEMVGFCRIQQWIDLLEFRSSQPPLILYSLLFL